MELVEQLQSGAILPFMLVLARISGLFLMAPVFSSRVIPVRVKLLVALAVAFAATPVAAHGREIAQLEPVQLALLVLKEVVVGLAISFSVAVVFAAISLAGALIDLSVGFSFANVADPLQNTQISVIGQWYSLVASAVFLTVGGHVLLVASLVRSFDVVPIDRMPDFGDLAAGVLASATGLFAVGLQIAAPILVTLLVTDIAIGFLARTSPQMNVFGVELPVKVGAMFALMIVTAPFLATGMAGHIGLGLDRALAAVIGA